VTNRSTGEALAARVTEAMTRLRVPGVAVGILCDGEETMAGFGVTNIDHPLPVDADTLFQIGSTTKTITGTAAMRLVEMGTLDLAAPVREYLPGLRLSDPDAAARVTLRHLFTHTAGWLGDYFDDFGPGDDALDRMVRAMAALPQVTPLGEVWSYNNAGFYLAGRVIEVAAGKPYEAAVQELVFDPLGMTRSFFFASDAIIHRVAVGHHTDGGEPVVARPWPLPRCAHPAGGVISTARDQLRYARFHLGDGAGPDGARLLSRASMEAMQSPQVAAESGDAWGLTWGLRRVNGVRVVRHGGATNGQLSAFVMVPERGFAVTVLTNADSGGLLHDEIVRWALARYVGLEVPEPVPVAIPTERAREYAGRYTGALTDLEIKIENGALALDVIPKGGFPLKSTPARPAPPTMRLAYLGDDRFVVLDGIMKGRRGEFLRDAAGKIIWLRASRVFKREASC
jgi:CubicO group peptidase (beta-lactamase class C family)